ncbi:type I restriction enzyme subunit R domain-containing protein [Aggregatibacter actinomycetemcomitans]|uniref:type I restriction enzyme subunit R domain-containing protein n=2 Tax=Aggregatibacter actinomycetemcomitans TaxID=714 RepID=UPI003BF4BC7E
MNISQAAKLTGLSAKQIRDYEKLGLLNPGARTLAGYRHYEESDLKRLHFIRHSRDVGFSLQQIAQLLQLQDNPQRNSREVKKLTAQHIETLNDQIQALQKMVKVVIVRDMWLTGFDAPCCNTMYLDKPMKGHNLMQAIARVNRVFANKSRENGGLIVDYVGLAEELKEATQQYTNSTGKGKLAENAQEVFFKMKEQLEFVRTLFATKIDGKAFDVNTAIGQSEAAALLKAIALAANHIATLDQLPDDGKAHTRNGDLVATWCCKGVTFETAENYELNLSKEKLNTLIQSFSKKGVSFYQHNIRHKVNETLDGHFSSEFTQEVNDKYYAGFNNGTLQRNILYITLVYTPYSKLEKISRKTTKLKDKKQELAYHARNVFPLG